MWQHLLSCNPGDITSFNAVISTCEKSAEWVQAPQVSEIIRLMI